MPDGVELDVDEPHTQVPSRQPRSPSRPLVGPFSVRQLAVVAAVVVAAAAVLFVLTRPLAAPAANLPSPGASFYAIASPGQGLQLGSRAPDFTGRDGDAEVRLLDLDGEEVRMTDFAGRPLWVVFWASWCPPCQQETPDIRAAYEAHQGDIDVLAISIQEPRDVVAPYASLYELEYRIGLDTSAAIMRTYGVFGLPTHYFIDANGVIRDRYFGPLRREQMDARIEFMSSR